MKKIFLFFLLCLMYNASAQNFMSKGMIEYEVKINNRKALGDGMWAEAFKDKVPKLTVSYYQLNFDDNKSVYQFNRINENTKSPIDDGSDQQNIWYNDYTAGNFVQQKSVFGDTYILMDSLVKIKWKITNESLVIAGYKCRKAIGILFDSVYVFAFYTDEITISGGPMGLHGLPGMIMGVTIPRMFSSWVATNVIMLPNDKIIIPPTKGKKYKANDLLGKMKEATKDWGTYGQQAIWKIFL